MDEIKIGDLVSVAPDGRNGKVLDFYENTPGSGMKAKIQFLDHGKPRGAPVGHYLKDIKLVHEAKSTVSLKGLASKMGLAKGLAVRPNAGLGPKGTIIDFRLGKDSELIALVKHLNKASGPAKWYPAKDLKRGSGGGRGRNKSRRGRRSTGGGKKKSKRGKRTKRMKQSLSNSLSSMSDFLSPKKGKKSKRGKKGKTVKRSKGKKRPLNPYMKALKKARDNDEESFTYNGKTYYQKTTKTGMKIYAAR